MSELWLVRHGPTEWSKAGRHTSVTDLPLLNQIKGRLGWLDDRQRVIAQNVANADSPGFRPLDLKPPSVDPARAGVSVARTSIGHMSLSTANGGFDGTGAPPIGPVGALTGSACGSAMPMSSEACTTRRRAMNRGSSPAEIIRAR